MVLQYQLYDPSLHSGRPFDPAIILAGEVLAAGEEIGGGAFAGAELFLQVIGQAAGELEHRLGWEAALAVSVGDQLGIAFPADLDAGEEIRLGTDQLVEPARLEQHLAEDLGIGNEADRGAAPVGRAADMLERSQRLPLAEALAIELLVACDLDGGVDRQRIDHRDADAVQAARSGIGLAGEFAARVEHREDHLERRLVGEFRVRIDRHAAAIVDNGDAVAGLQRDFDAIGMAGDRFVHRIVEDLGGQVVQRALVGAADIHARAAPDRLQPFEDFDRGGVIGAGGHARRSKQVFSGHGERIGGAG
jgi:hypothetical protein